MLGHYIMQGAYFSLSCSFPPIGQNSCLFFALVCSLAFCIAPSFLFNGVEAFLPSNSLRSPGNDPTKIICLLNIPRGQTLSGTLEELKKSLVQNLKARGILDDLSVEEHDPVGSMIALSDLRGVVFEKVDLLLAPSILSYFSVQLSSPYDFPQANCTDNVFLTTQAVSRRHLLRSFEESDSRRWDRSDSETTGRYSSAQRRMARLVRASSGGLLTRDSAQRAGSVFRPTWYQNNYYEYPINKYFTLPPRTQNMTIGIAGQATSQSTVAQSMSSPSFTNPQIPGGQIPLVSVLSTAPVGYTYPDPYFGVRFPNLKTAGVTTASVVGDSIHQVGNQVGNLFGAVAHTSANVLQGMSAFNDKVYLGAKQTTTLLQEYEKYRQMNPEDTLTQFVNKFEEVTKEANGSPKISPIAQVDENPNLGNPFDISGAENALPKEVLAHLDPAQAQELRVMNAVIGTGFDVLLNTLGAEQLQNKRIQQGQKNVLKDQTMQNGQSHPSAPAQIYPNSSLMVQQEGSRLGQRERLSKMQQQDSKMERLESPQKHYNTAIQDISEVNGQPIQLPIYDQELRLQPPEVQEQVRKIQQQQQSLASQHREPEQVDQLLNISTAVPASNRNNRRLSVVEGVPEVEISGLVTDDQILSSIVRCECTAHPEGTSCPMEKASASVTCLSMPVLNAKKGGAELADVMKALDASLASGANVVMIPVWFETSQTSTEERAASQVFGMALKRALDSGIMIGLASGYEEIFGKLDTDPGKTVYAVVQNGTENVTDKSTSIVDEITVSAALGNPLEMSVTPLRRRLSPLTNLFSGGSNPEELPFPTLFNFGNFLTRVGIEVEGADENDRTSPAGITENGVLANRQLPGAVAPLSALGNQSGDTLSGTSDDLNGLSSSQSPTSTHVPSTLSSSHTDAAPPSSSQSTDPSYQANAFSGGSGVPSTSLSGQSAIRPVVVPKVTIGVPAGSSGGLLGGSGGLGGAVSSASNWFQTSQAVFEAGNAMFSALPLQQMLETSQQLYKDGFFRNRGIKTLSGPGIGVDKQFALPPPGVGNPSVECSSMGMTCCVPQNTVEDWRDNPPYLNDDKSPVCQAKFISMKAKVCATTPYEGSSCGIVKTETSEFLIYQHVLTIPRRSMNNAICECRHSKDGDKSMDGSVSWQYSVQAVKLQAKKEERGEKLAQGIGTALAWTQLVNQQGNAAMNGLGEVMNGADPKPIQSTSLTYPLASSSHEGRGGAMQSFAEGAKVLSDAANLVHKKQLGIASHGRDQESYQFGRYLRVHTPLNVEKAHAEMMMTGRRHS